MIAEFTCDQIVGVVTNFFGYPVYHQKAIDDACISLEDAEKYSDKKTVYGWHISDLKVYDKPKELSEFKTLDIKKIKSCQYRQRVFQNPDCLDNGSLIYGGVYCTEKEDWCCNCRKKSLKRPPQSWCYVEALE